MATKTELLTIVDSVYEDRCQPEEIGNETWNGKSKKTYRVNVLQAEGNKGKFKSVNFYVLNEGVEGNEVAYFDLNQNYPELVV
jgi:hypothetical protein